MITYLRRFKKIKPESDTYLTVQNAIPYLVQRIEQKANHKKCVAAQEQDEPCDRFTVSSSS